MCRHEYLRDDSVKQKYKANDDICDIGNDKPSSADEVVLRAYALYKAKESREEDACAKPYGKDVVTGNGVDKDNKTDNQRD